MAYTKTTWINGSAPPISAENLNKIEDGIYNNELNIESVRSEIPVIQSGTASVSAGAGAYADTAVSFGTPFESTPVVFLTSKSSATVASYGNTEVSVFNVTKNGFTIRFFNASTASRSPNIGWIAILA